MISHQELIRYQDFLNLHQDKALLFHQPWWLDIVCGEGKWSVFFLEKNGRLIDVMPYCLDKKYIFKLLRPPLLTPYLDNFFEENVSFIIESLKKLADDLIVPFSFYKSKLAITTTIRPTYTIDLSQSQDDIIGSYHPMRKRNINKAKSKYKTFLYDFDVDKFYHWHRASFDNKNSKYPYTKDFLQSVIEQSIAKKSLFNISAYDGGNCVGQIFIFHDKHTAYYLLGAYDKSETANTSMSLLMHESILYAKKIGLKVFDFEGSRDKGIADFFSKFGGVRREYQVVELHQSMLWDMKKRLLG